MKNTDAFALRLDRVQPEIPWGVHWADSPQAAGELLSQLANALPEPPIWLFRGNETIEIKRFNHLGGGRCRHEEGLFNVTSLATGRGVNGERCRDFVYVTNANQYLSSFLLAAQFSPYNVNGDFQPWLREALDKIEAGEFTLEEVVERGFRKLPLHPADR